MNVLSAVRELVTAIRELAATLRQANLDARRAVGFDGDAVPAEIEHATADESNGSQSSRRKAKA